jgi:hypothetical protein
MRAPRLLLVLAIVAAFPVVACGDGSGQGDRGAAPGTTRPGSTAPGVLASDPAASDPAAPPPRPTATVRPGTVAALQPGDCFDHPGLEIGDLRIDTRVISVDCVAPHDSQLYAQLKHPAAPTAGHPGDGAVSAFARDRCLEVFPGFVGIDYVGSALDFAALWPEQGRWDEGSRAISCALYHADFQPLIGSAQGAAQ